MCFVWTKLIEGYGYEILCCTYVLFAFGLGRAQDTKVIYFWGTNKQNWTFPCIVNERAEQNSVPTVSWTFHHNDVKKYVIKNSILASLMLADNKKFASRKLSQMFILMVFLQTILGTQLRFNLGFCRWICICFSTVHFFLVCPGVAPFRRLDQR